MSYFRNLWRRFMEANLAPGFVVVSETYLESLKARVAQADRRAAAQRDARKAKLTGAGDAATSPGSFVATAMQSNRSAAIGVLSAGFQIADTGGGDF